MPLIQLSPADISHNVRPEPRHAPPGWSINGYVALIADETSGLGVIDHYPKELQVAVAVSPAMRKEAVQLAAMCLRFIVDVCNEERGR